MQQPKPKMRFLNKKLYQLKFDEAYSLYLGQQYERSLTILIELRGMGFTDKELFIKIIQILIELQQYEKAQEYFFKLVEIYPGCEQEQEIQNIKDQIKGLMKRTSNQQIKLEPIKIDNNDFLLLLLSIQKNDIGEKLMQQTEFDNNRIFKTAMTYYYSGRYKMSYNLCQKIHEQSLYMSKNILIYMNLYMMNKYEKAINHIQSLEYQVENNNMYQIWIGDCYFQQKQYRKALSFYYQVKPILEKTFFFISMSKYHLIEDLEEIQFEKCQQFTIPSNIDYLIKLSVCLNSLSFKKPEEINNCLAYQIKVLNQRQEIMLIYHHLCNKMCYYSSLVCSLKLKKDGLELQKQCLDVLQQYSFKMAETYEDYYYLQQLEHKQIMIDELIEKVQNCYESDTKNKLLAKLFYDSGKLASAQDYSILALKLNPYDNEIYEQLLKIYEENDEFENRDQLFLEQVKVNRFNFIWIYEKLIQLLTQMKFGEVLEILELLPNDESNTNFFKLITTLLLNNNKEQTVLVIEQTNLNLQQKILLKACYFLQQKKVEEAQSLLTQNFNQKFLSDQAKNGINIFYTRIYLMIGLVFNIQIQQHDLINRYYSIIFFILSSIIFPENNQQLIRIMNKQFQQKVPILINQISKFANIVRQIYKFENNLDICAIFQLGVKQNIVSNLNEFLINFNNFINNTNQETWQKICVDYTLNNEANTNIFKSNPLVQEIYQMSYFQDQLAQQAFEYSLKIIGYINQFQTNFNQIESISKFLTQMFISILPQKYYIDIITIMHL